MPTSIDGLPDAVLISSGSHHATFPLIAQSVGGSGLRVVALWNRQWRDRRLGLWLGNVYKTLKKKRGVGHSLIKNHLMSMATSVFVTPAIGIFLLLNLYEIDVSVDEQGTATIDVAK